MLPVQSRMQCLPCRINGGGYIRIAAAAARHTTWRAATGRLLVDEAPRRPRWAAVAIAYSSGQDSRAGDEIRRSPSAAARTAAGCSRSPARRTYHLAGHVSDALCPSARFTSSVTGLGVPVARRSSGPNRQIDAAHLRASLPYGLHEFCEPLNAIRSSRRGSCGSCGGGRCSPSGRTGIIGATPRRSW
jgi:hypothetical protein